MKLGIITDEISQDLEQALDFISGYSLGFCELRELWGKNIMNLTPEEKTHTSKLLLYTIGTMGFLSQLLQVWNIATLNLFWPFFFAIVMHLMAGMLQFTRMVLLLPEKA